jgi:hypothetical protein
VYRSHDDEFLPFQQNQGDFNKDGRIDSKDLALWKEEVGQSGSGFLADANNDGFVGGSDFLLWQQWAGTGGAWYMPVGFAASGASLMDSTSAPEVVNVTIIGSTSTHMPYSFATHVGSGVQLQTVPVGGADTIAITFSEQVNVEATNLKLVGLTTGHVPVMAEFNYDSATFTATWRFTGLTANDVYAITLSDAITDTQGYRLDGEWTNPVSTTTTNVSVSHFPSGNGHAGGNFVFVFTLMSGDADFDNTVGDADVNIWAEYYSSVGATFGQGDFNGNGQVDIGTDLDLMFANYGKSLQSVSILGDLNGDFVVNDTDLTTLVNSFGMSSPTHADGDLNCDGHIDNADMDLMFAQYGLELNVA